MKRVLFVLCVLYASSAVAQTHPCSLAEQTTATKGTRVGWCVPADDLTGVSWHVKISSNVVISVPAGQLPPVGGPDPANGLYYLEVNLPSGYSKGLYPVAIYGQSADGTGPDSDTKMWQVGGPPVKPSKPRIAGGSGE
jgi:hypothetical protein